MLNQLETEPYNPHMRHHLVVNWLTSRRALLISWHQLLSKLTKEKQTLTHHFKALDNFCLKFVDYLSQGHFQKYQQVELMLSTELLPAFRANVYPLLEDNTYHLLTIYDNELESAAIAGKPHGLCQVLSTLGELLEQRFVLEDKLINALPETHTSAVITLLPSSLPDKRLNQHRTKRI